MHGGKILLFVIKEEENVIVEHKTEFVHESGDEKCRDEAMFF